MRFRALLVTGVVGVALLAGALVGPAQAAPRKLEGFITSPQAPAWTGLFAGETGTGGETVTAYAFAVACQQDRDAHAAGNPAGATHIAEFLASPQNGFDGYVWDLGAPVEGAFAVEGPGATEVVPDVGQGLYVNDYDLDLDFFTGAEVNAADYDHTDGGIGCPNANRVPGSDHKCYSHTQNAHEKSSCQVGYKVGKTKHLPRYVMVSGSFNLKGPMDLVLTAP